MLVWRFNDNRSEDLSSYSISTALCLECSRLTLRNRPLLQSSLHGLTVTGTSMQREEERDKATWRDRDRQTDTDRGYVADFGAPSYRSKCSSFQHTGNV